MIDDTAAAMQGAMVSMLREGYSPRQWASFVVFGGASRECDPEDLPAMLQAYARDPAPEDEGSDSNSDSDLAADIARSLV